MNCDHYYWFFSTSSQVLGALIGLLGIFSVYALQQIHNSLESRRRDLAAYCGIAPGHDKSYYSLEVLLKGAEDKGYFSKIGSADALNTIKDQVSTLKKSKLYIENTTIILIIGLSMALSLSLVLLSMSSAKCNELILWLYGDLAIITILLAYIVQYIWRTIQLIRFDVSVPEI